MTKSAFQKATERSRKIRCWLVNRGWEIDEDQYFAKAQERIREIKINAVKAELGLLDKCFREAEYAGDNNLFDLSGRKVKITSKDRRQAKAEMKRIHRAMDELRSLQEEL